MAVISVMLFHAGFGAFSGGFTGVDVFFVISGYLIADRIISDRLSGKFAVRDFFERRARRILPAMLLMMLTCLPLAWAWLLPGELHRFSQSLLATIGLSSNVLFWLRSGYFDAANETVPLIHTWSLSVEEQFYLLFPFMMILGWRARSARMWVWTTALALVSLMSAQWLTLAYPAAAFYSLPARAWEILIGASAAMVLRQVPSKDWSKNLAEPMSLSGIALMTTAVFAFDEGTPFPGAAAMVPTTGALLIIVFATSRTLVGRALSARPLVGLGLISYGAYLWHQPIFAFARLRLMRELSTAEYLQLMALALIVAWASWRYVETPFRDRRRTPVRMLAGSASVCGGVVLAFGAAGLGTRGFPERMPAAAMDVLMSADVGARRRDGCHFSAADLPTPGTACIIGDERALVGALLGDSHAAALSGPLSRALHRRGLGMLSLSYSSCPPAPGLYRVEDRASRCDEFNDLVTAEVLSDPGIRYVVLAARWTLYIEKRRFDDGEGGAEPGGPVSVDEVRDGRKLRNREAQRRSLVKARYADAIRRYMAAGKTVVLVYPVPEAGHDVPAYLARTTMLGTGVGQMELTTSWPRFVERNKQAIELFDSLDGGENLRRVRPADVLCNTRIPGRCLTHEGTRVYYTDTHHLSDLGASMVIEPIMEVLTRGTRSRRDGSVAQ